MKTAAIKTLQAENKQTNSLRVLLPRAFLSGQFIEVSPLTLLCTWPVTLPTN
jgi:hypothetical protein